MVTVYAAMRDALLVVTGDAGDWRATERFVDHGLECVAVHPDVPDRVFVGTYDAGVWRSEDGGESWTRVGETSIVPDEDPETARRRGVGDVSAMAAAVSPHDPDEVWVGTEPSAVFRSRDGGDSWTAAPGLTALPSEPEWYFPPRPYTHHVRWIEPDPNDPDRLYVGIEAGALVVTPDAGETWEERPPGSRSDNHSLATHVDAPGRVYAAAGDGYAESRDAGEHWEHPQAGLDHRYVWSVAVDPGDPDAVAVSAAAGARRAHTPATAESYVYRRRDDDGWRRVDDGLPSGEGVVRAVLASGAASGECYAVNNRGLFRSTDAGASWQRLDLSWPDRFAEQTPSGLAVV